MSLGSCSPPASSSRRMSAVTSAVSSGGPWASSLKSPVAVTQSARSSFVEEASKGKGAAALTGLGQRARRGALGGGSLEGRQDGALDKCERRVRPRAAAVGLGVTLRAEQLALLAGERVAVLLLRLCLAPPPALTALGLAAQQHVAALHERLEHGGGVAHHRRRGPEGQLREGLVLLLVARNLVRVADQA